jgi:hypothetical protein
MTHSHDKTLLVSLGFSDKDKKNPRHDLACQYLAQAPVFTKLMAPNLAPGCGVALAPLHHEFHITKGEKQYKTTIGFADLFVKNCMLIRRLVAAERVPCPPMLRANEAIKGWSEGQADLKKRKAAQWEAWEVAHAAAPDSPFFVFARIAVLVEVKIKPVSAGDILRQMRLYSEYLPDLGRVFALDDNPKLVAGTPRYRYCYRPSSATYGDDGCRCAARHAEKYFGSAADWMRFQKLVVTDFPLTADEVGTLRSAGVTIRGLRGVRCRHSRA